jgi:tRNA(Arg) A34 adenosine deaminase TadA
MENQTIHEEFMRIAIAYAEKNVTEQLGGPFGAVVVRDGEIIAASGNRTAHRTDA